MCSRCAPGAGRRVLGGRGREAHFVLVDDAPVGGVPLVLLEVVGADPGRPSQSGRIGGVLALESAG